MEKSLLFAVFSVEIGLLDTVSGFPIDFSSVGSGQLNPIWLTGYFLTAFGFLLSIIAVVFGCVCCRNGKGFKEFSNSSGSLATPHPDGFVNPTSNAELTIFPPAGANSNQICRFEPLPDIKPQAPHLRPAAFSYSEREISSQDWFLEPYSNFPRHQLKYVQEYGRGWFGRVVEGEAQNITPKEKLTKVMVKILHEDATATDQMYFLHEVKFYRDLKHPNILRLLGQCLETEPFLILLEYYPNGDLKSFLSQNLASARALAEQSVTLQMCSNITSGLEFMHNNKFIHTDLAARNCLVGPDLTVKIGDYGNSIEVFKSDYYCAGSVALPIRWCAPETLKCTDMTIETREVTPPANIWSLAVVFWEICEFCKLPYTELNDDQVIVKVLGEKNYFLEKPNMYCLHKDELFHLMKLCWNPPLQRPTASQIHTILDNLISSSRMTQNNSKRISQDFEQRWQNLKPNYIPKKCNAVEVNQSVNCNIISSKLKNDRVVDSSLIDTHLGVFMSNESTGQESPRFCIKSEKGRGSRISESSEKSNLDFSEKLYDKKDSFLPEPKEFSASNGREQPQDKVNFQYNSEINRSQISNSETRFKGGSDVDSWLKGVEINNEEDESFVRKISEAIRDLDATLALEKTSSSEEASEKSSHQNSPGKDVTENNETTVDFKLGSDTSSFLNFTQKNFELTSLQNTEQPQSLNFTDPFFVEDQKELDENYGPSSLILPSFKDPNNAFITKSDLIEESLKENDSLVCSQSRNSSDTDDEVWRKRIERGEISEKVKEKSKSIANLMILTHIDASDDSDIDLDKPFEKGLNRNNLLRRSGSFAKSSFSSNNFGSENDITNAVLEDEFKESLKKLSNDHKEHGHFDSLTMILPTSARKEVVWENFFKFPQSEEGGLTSAAKDEYSLDGKKHEDSDSEKGRNLSNLTPGDKNDQNPSSHNFLANVASEKLKTKQEELSDIENGLSLISKENIRPEMDSRKTLAEFVGETNCGKSEGSLGKSSSHLPETNNKSFCDFVNYDETENFAFEKMNSENDEVLLSPSRSEVVQIAPEAVLGDFREICRKENREPNEFSCPSNTSLVPLYDSKIECKMSNNRMCNVIPEVKVLQQRCTIIIPRVNSAEAEDNIPEIEKIFNFIMTKRKQIRFVFEDYGFIDLLKRSDELGKFFKQNESKFEFVTPVTKPLKFALNESKVTSELKPHEFDQKKVGVLENVNLIAASNSWIPLPCNKKSLEKPNENNESQVIMGACEDFTLDFFKGLKTTSENVIDVEKRNEKNFQKIMNFNFNEPEILRNDHFFHKQLTNANLNDGSVGIEDLNSTDLEKQDVYANDAKETKMIDCSVKSIMNFIESEKLHTEKVEESIDINQMTSFSGAGSEEEYDNFKLRTPDDERSSDSGFRDKGSLSESVEDACEGKYNLEDIEAELEEAYIKDTFGNSEKEKGKDLMKDSLNVSNNFEFEESKFYEDENKNEEDFSDLDGEIEFWQNKDSADYYPEISEFNPVCSQGWYLHPPDENLSSFNRNVNEDIVNALRNELRESLPIQTRSFVEFNDFYEPDSNNLKRELNIHYLSNLAVPLSPITEEQDAFMDENFKKNKKNFLFERGTSSKMRKSGIKILESVKGIDTNVFMQYLDYMIENEGKELSEMEEIEEKIKGNKMGENLDLPALMLEKDQPDVNYKNFEEDIKNALGINLDSESESLESDEEQTGLLLEDLESGTISKVAEETKPEDDVLIVNTYTNEVTMLENTKPKSYNAFSEIIESRDESPDVIMESSENIGLVFSPEVLSPDRERSLSEISRSSNGTRTGDALSDITLSSPDLVPDCFSTSIQEIIQNNEANEIVKELEDRGLINEFDCSATAPNSPEMDTCTLPRISPKPKIFPNHLTPDATPDAFDAFEDELSESPKNQKTDKNEEFSNGRPEVGGLIDTSDVYEMTTSFMGDDCDESETESKAGDSMPNPEITDLKANGIAENFYPADWESESSGDEENVSSSSGEFIWKEGDKESKLKAVQATDCDIEKSLHAKSKIDQSTDGKTPSIKSPIKNEIDGNRESSDDENDDDSSSGSSTSITDFVPSAWNSHATPSRPALKSPDKKVDQQRKKNVWFKKQKYHCVYEYPREPSDNEESESSSYPQFNYENNFSDSANKHLSFKPDAVESPKKHFSFGISNVIDYSSFTDWDVVEADDADLNLTDTDSDNGKSEQIVSKKPDFNFYNLSPFDYDFGNSGESEFFVSSSSRPFQGGSSSQFFHEKHRPFVFYDNSFSGNLKTDEQNLKDFVTPDSGLEDSSDATPLDQKIDLNQKDIIHDKSSSDINVNNLDNFKLNYFPEIVKNNEKKSNEEIFRNNSNSNPNDLFTSTSNIPSSTLSPVVLGELRHARNKLKLDLPISHNVELGEVINKKNQQNSFYF